MSADNGQETWNLCLSVHELSALYSFFRRSEKDHDAVINGIYGQIRNALYQRLTIEEMERLNAMDTP